MLLLLIAMAISVGLWLAMRSTGASHGEGQAPVALRDDTGSAPPARPQGPPGGSAGSSGRADLGPLPRPSGELDFSGRGSIRGSVELAQGAVLPAAYAVVAVPSLWLPGRQFAVERRGEVVGGRTEFALDDVPFGAYQVRIEAAGLNARSVDVQLSRGNESPYVILEVSPAGFLAGSLLDEDGAAVEDFQVWLEPLPEGERRGTTSDPAGLWRFDAVPDGDYQLLVGHPGYPAVPARRLAFRAPAMNLAPIEVPVFARLEVRVADAAGVPLEGVHVRGTSDSGSYVSELSDVEGRVIARYLRGGRYRLRASHSEHGSATEVVLLERGERAELELVLEP